MSYPCTGCGLCCRMAGRAVDSAKQLLAMGRENDNPFVKEVAEFPYNYDATGRCEMLNDDNTCKVYDTRPDICSIDRTWKKYREGQHPLEESYRQNIEACNELIRKFNYPDKYLINVTGKEASSGEEKA